jgi:hypothetical protein
VTENPGELLASQRAAFLAVSQASIDATLDAAAIQREPPSRERNERFLAVLHRMVALQTQTLAAHDAVVRRAEELGVDAQVVAEFREGRAALDLQLQHAATHARQLEAGGLH